MDVVGIIPARLQSSRLPRKLLLADTGKPLIQYTWEAACRTQSLREIVVATDSEEIAAVVRAFGGKCVLTAEHPSGTDRIAEVARRSFPRTPILVNIQGDEPEIDPASIDTVVQMLIENPRSQMATLATPVRSVEQLRDPACVKAVCGADGRALYFSRAPVPFSRDVDPAVLLEQEHPWLVHLGLYAYRRDFLQRLTQLPPSPLEQLEKLEQLRALEAGASIQVGVVAHRSVGIDTPDDYAHFVARQRGRAAA